MSFNYSDAQALQAYVRDYHGELFTQLVAGFDSAVLATPHEGLKGELVLTQLKIGDNLIRRWAKSFDPVLNAVDFKPRTLRVQRCKVDVSVAPQEFESSYLGMFRQKGQNPRDLPFEAVITNELMKEINLEQEFGVWKAVKTNTPGAGDVFNDMFDGWLQIIATEITAGNITPVTTGSISTSNIIDKLRLMWDAVKSPYKRSGVDILMSYAMYDTYRKAYKDAYKVDPAYIAITDAGYDGLMYELGTRNSRIIPVTGLQDSNRIIMAPRGIWRIGWDDPADVNFNVEMDKREVHMWFDFMFGVEIAMVDEGILVVNDQS